MTPTVHTRIVKIGNSQGVRIPKHLLTQSGIGDEVELSLQEDQIVIRPAHRPRHDWGDDFREINKKGGDIFWEWPNSQANRNDLPLETDED